MNPTPAKSQSDEGGVETAQLEPSVELPPPPNPELRRPSWDLLFRATGFLYMHREKVGVIKDSLAGLQSIATILALLIGGIWTYQGFIKQRLGRPRLTIQHHLTSRRITADAYMLALDIVLTNTGTVVVPVGEEHTSIEQMAPLSRDQEHDFVSGRVDNLKAPGDDELRLIPVPNGDVKKDWSKEDMRLEPGEVDQIHREFLIPTWMKTVRVYSFIKNPHDDKIGWDWTSVYDLGTEQAGK